VSHLQQAAHNYNIAATSLPSDAPNAAVRETALDHALMHAEQALTRPEGLPRRPWFRHQIYAPGFYTGYGVKTVPGVREAIEEKNWTEASQQIVVVSKVIENYAAQVNRAADIARGRSE